MSVTTLTLDADPERALDVLRQASQDAPVLVFKKSPICPVSHRAESQWRHFLEGDDHGDFAACEIDVIAEKPLARGLVAALGIAHESPQALLFKDGEVVWHDSHGALTATRFAEELKKTR